MAQINWIRLGKEIATMPNGIAVLRMLQAHGVEHLVQFRDGGTVQQASTVETVIDYAHKEK